MAYRYIAPFICSMLLVPIACAQTTNLSAHTVTPKKTLTPPDPNKFAVIINGAVGEPAYAKQFAEWTAELSTVLTQRFGFAASHVKVLTEKPAEGTSLRATAEEVKRTFALLKSDLQPDNVLFVFLIGHGSFDGKESKFNLVGPDLSASKNSILLSSLPTRRVVVLNMASASGEFAKRLWAKGRLRITATRSGQETT